MSFGQSVTTFVTLFSLDDHVAPQVTADFVQLLPPSPIKGDEVSSFVQELYPVDPIQPVGLGSALSDFIDIFQSPDLGDGGLLL